MPLADFVAARGYPPERIDTRTATPGPNAGNAGFSAAVAPYLAALGRADLANAQAARTRSLTRDTPPGYYSGVLALFGLGFQDGLYRFDADHMVFGAFEVRVRPGGLTGIARGEPLDPARHLLNNEVKAITYHELKVEQTGDGWFAEVIVDI